MKESIVDAMGVFAVAHECSHHLQRYGRLLEASRQAEGDRRARGEKFEAGSIAIMLWQMVTGYKAVKNLMMISGAGIVTLLNALGLVTTTRMTLGLCVRRVADTHPTAQDRLAMIDRQPHVWGTTPMR